MEAKIKKCIIKEIKKIDCGSNNLQVCCDSIVDFPAISALEILQGQGVHRYKFDLYNCADRKEELSKELIGKIVSVCVYTFYVSELTNKGTKARIYEYEDETNFGVTSTMTYAVPCADDFKPKRTDYMIVKDKLKGDLEDRNGAEIIEPEEDANSSIKGVHGYVEVDGIIIKVRSIEDLRHIVENYEQFIPF